MESSVISDILQWLGIGGAGGLGLFAMGKKDQKLIEHDRRLSEVEDRATKALERTESNGRSIARVEATQELVYDLVKRIDIKLDQRPVQ